MTKIFRSGATDELQATLLPGITFSQELSIIVSPNEWVHRLKSSPVALLQPNGSITPLRFLKSSPVESLDPLSLDPEVSQSTEISQVSKGSREVAEKYKRGFDMSTKGVDTSTKPIDTSTKPIDRSTKPIDTSTKPIDTSTTPTTPPPPRPSLHSQLQTALAADLAADLAAQEQIDLRTTRRSKSGCWTCRLRHKSCSEEKPWCWHCKRLGLRCDYSTCRPDYMKDGVKKRQRLDEIKAITRMGRGSRSVDLGLGPGLGPVPPPHGPKRKPRRSNPRPTPKSIRTNSTTTTTTNSSHAVSNNPSLRL